MDELPLDAIEEKGNLARDVVLALARCIRVRRMYPSDHVRCLETTEGLVAKFLEFFNTYAYLRLEVRPDELRFEKCAIMRGEPREPDLPFVLYKDGLREIRFHRGMSRDEVLSLVNILETTPAEVRDAAEDYLSLLWARNFASVDYLAVDEFDLAAAPGERDSEVATEVKELAEEIDRLTAGFLAPTLPARERPPAPGAAALPPPAPASGSLAEIVDLAGVFAGDPEELFKPLRAAVEHDTVGSSVARVIKALRGMPAVLPDAEIHGVVEGLVEHYVQRHDYCAIGHLCEHLGRLGPQGAGLEHLIRMLGAELSSKEMPANLIEHLNRHFVDDLDGLRRFMAALGDNACAVVCNVYAKVAAPRTRHVLREFILRDGARNPDAIRKLLFSGESLLPEVLDLLMELRPATLVKDLEEFVQHPILAIRLQAITLLGRIEGHERTQKLFGLLNDPDRRIRQQVFRTLAEARDPGTVFFLREWIEGKAFLERDLTDKSSAFQTLAAVTGEAVIPFLVQIALRRPPFLGRVPFDEMRHAAVDALGRMGGAAARAALERLAREGDDQVRVFAWGLLET